MQYIFSFGVCPCMCIWFFGILWWWYDEFTAVLPCAENSTMLQAWIKDSIESKAFYSDSINQSKHTHTHTIVCPCSSSSYYSVIAFTCPVLCRYHHSSSHSAHYFFISFTLAGLYTWTTFGSEMDTTWRTTAADPPPHRGLVISPE